MNSIIKTPWKKVIKILANKDSNYKINLIMEDRNNLELDLTPLIKNNNNFWRLKTLRYFKQVTIDPLGGLSWPEGEDISPTKILDYIKS